jgi:hypothetical protein
MCCGCCLSLHHCPFLIKSGKEALPLLENDMKVMDAQATSLRQTEEWGLRALQASFPCLKENIIYSDNIQDRMIFLSLIQQLYNFVGLSQIQFTFYPNFKLHRDDVLDLLICFKDPIKIDFNVFIYY